MFYNGRIFACVIVTNKRDSEVIASGHAVISSRRKHEKY